MFTWLIHSYSTICLIDEMREEFVLCFFFFFKSNGGQLQGFWIFLNFTLYFGRYSASFVSESEIPPDEYILEIAGTDLIFLLFLLFQLVQIVCLSFLKWAVEAYKWKYILMVKSLFNLWLLNLRMEPALLVCYSKNNTLTIKQLLASIFILPYNIKSDISNISILQVSPDSYLNRDFFIFLLHIFLMISILWNIFMQFPKGNFFCSSETCNIKNCNFSSWSVKT